MIGIKGFRRFLSVIRRAPLARLVFFLLIVFLFILPFKLILGFIPGRNSFPAAVLVLITAFAVLLMVLYRWLVPVFENREVTELSLRSFVSPLLSGVACGFGLFSSTMGILTGIGVARFHGLNAAEGMLKSAIINGHAAIFEEILFRGIIYRLLEERFGSAIGLFLSAVLFGLVHLANPGASLTSTITIALTAGLLLPLAFCASRTLWLPIGLHFSWNFTESGLFSLAVSGFNLHGLIRIDLVGPTLLTGGSFGSEASIVTVGVCVVASAVFGYIAWRRGNWVSLRIKSPGRAA